jgi:hypothetical protein
MPGGDGSYVATGANLSIAGFWSVTVVARTGTAAVEVPLVLRTVIPDQQVQIQRNPGLPDIYDVSLVVGGSLQLYADPGQAGRNEVHATFFDTAGNELPVERADIALAASREGALQVLTTRMLEPGHFVADTTLSTGTIVLVVTGTAPDGSDLAAQIELTIGS